MSAWEDAKAAFACSHELQELRHSTASNGARQYRMQCLRCGWLSEFLKKTHPKVMAICSLPPEVDRSLQEVWNKQIEADWQRRLELERQEQVRESKAKRDQASIEWWTRYHAYIESPEWKRKRRAVLDRDGHLCQACRSRTATQVHHLTYDHFGNEPLFELVSICEICHDGITRQDRERRGVGIGVDYANA